MEPHAYLGDPQREREIHHLLDQIQVPDESLSDVSSDIMLGRSTYEPDSQLYLRGASSPGRHHEDFFENSINSTIAHTSPLSNINLNEDSKLDSSHSQAFTPQQVSRMMDWSKNHITQAEGLFPQVSAPSMSIEGDMWESSPQETPLPTMILRSHSHSSIDRSQNHSKKSLSNLPVLDLPTHEEKPSREVITFSPNNAEANWYFNPAQNSKRSSANQSLKFPKNSFSTELMQGSALLAHAANQHFPSEVSLSQIRENAPIFDEIHRLKSELSNLKVAFRSEQNMHEDTKKELFQCSNALQEVEALRIELEDKNEELEEKVKLLVVKQKNPESIEQLRGKTLEYARMEIKQLKGYLAEKEKKIEDYKHALSQKNNMENNSAREKEIDELTYEITRLKLVNTSQSKQIKELNERLGREGRQKDNTTGDLKSIIEAYEKKLQKAQEMFREQQRTIEEQQKDIAKNSKTIMDLRQICEKFTSDRKADMEEITLAKETIEVLQKQLSGSHFQQTTPADYDFQINKLKNIYEKKLDEARDDTNVYKNKCGKHEAKINALEIKIAKLIPNNEGSFDDEAKETIELLQEELKKLTMEVEILTRENSDLRANERSIFEKLETINAEKEEIEEELEQKDSELRENVNIVENMQLEYNRNVRKFEIDSQNNKDLLRQYEDEMDNLRFAKRQAEQLSDALKRQLEDIKNNESTYKLKAREEIEQELVKLKNTIQSITARTQLEKDELHQRLREKDQEIIELKQDLEESYKLNEEKIKMDMEYFKEKIEKEKEEEIKRIRKIYSSQSGTQTSFDYSTIKDEIKSKLESENSFKMADIEDKLRKALHQEIRAKVEEELSAKYKNISSSEKESYERRIDELKSDYLKKLEGLKAEYSKNTTNIEQEFMNKVRSIEKDHSFETQELELSLKQKIEDLKTLQKKIKDLEGQIFENSKASLKNISLPSSQEEINSIIRKTKDEIRFSFDRERQDLIEIQDREQAEMIRQKEKLINEVKIRDEQLEESKSREKKLQKEFEAKIDEQEAKFSREMEDYKAVYYSELKESERNFVMKERKMEKEFSERTQELTLDYQEKLQREQEKYSEMMSKKDILSKADNQRVKEEVSTMIAEKERELSEGYVKKQRVIKLQFDKDIKSKELEIEGLKENMETEKKRIRDEYTEKINNLKLEMQRNKREWDKEQKKLKEMAENAVENSKKDLELSHLENINKEKSEWERKEKNRLKVIQTKHLKELSEKEQIVKNEAEVEKNIALQELADSYKQKIRQVQEDQKKYYEELKNTALEEKAHEIELKVRRELQENYLKTISQMDSQHFQEKEKLREEFRNEMAKRVEEIRNSSYPECDNSYDMPFSNRKSRNPTQNSQELKNKIE